MNRFRYQVATLVTINVGLLVAASAQAGSWQSNAPFGATLQGDLYTPTTPAASPAIMVAIHYCSGNSSSAHGWFQSSADQYGFYIIAPNAGKNCFDSSASRSGDPAAIVKMVQYVITNKNADSSRVFAAGYSSGGCMTNTLLAIYPDVFVGGAALPGYPAGAWPAGDTSCSLCGDASRPNSSDTGQKYADMVKGVFSFSGTRPCVQEWVGGGDQYHFATWLPVVASEFQILGNLGSGTTGTGAPSGWTRTEYKDSSGHVMLQTNLGPSSQAHDLTGAGLNGQVISFLGLDKPTGACGLTSAGGASGTGGASSAGGNKATGGTTSAGGSKAAGGTSSAGGGAKATGGTSSFGGSGTKATGGSNSNTGGTPAAGGSPAGTGGTLVTPTGGSKATGGAVSNTGGIASVATGGTSSANTNVATGGIATATTTQPGTGGNGNPTVGGSAAIGGNATVGGNEAVGGETVSNSRPVTSGTGSCSCRVVGNHERSGSVLSLGLLGIAFAAWRRRRRE
jgi:acetylxylan esterase